MIIHPEIVTPLLGQQNAAAAKKSFVENAFTVGFDILLADKIHILSPTSDNAGDAWLELIDRFVKIPGFTAGILQNVGADSPGRTDEAKVIEYLRENDPDLLAQLHPVINGGFFLPPVGDYNVRDELGRLLQVNQRILDMDEAGVFDEIVDSIIGIQGLRDTITTEERADLKARVMNMGKAIIFEEEWQTAYIGRMTKRIDITLISLSDYFLNENRDVPKISMTNYGQIQNSEKDLFEKGRDMGRLELKRSNPNGTQLNSSDERAVLRDRG